MSANDRAGWSVVDQVVRELEGAIRLDRLATIGARLRAARELAAGKPPRDLLRRRLLAALGWFEARGVSADELINLELQFYGREATTVAHVKSETARRLGLVATTVRAGPGGGTHMRAHVDGVDVTWID